MPRCYMVKKALCNKYMSVTRGFENWGRGGRENSPSPSAMQLLVSPIETRTTLPATQECMSSSLKDVASSETLANPKQPTLEPAEIKISQHTASRSFENDLVEYPRFTTSPTCTMAPALPARATSNYYPHKSREIIVSLDNSSRTTMSIEVIKKDTGETDSPHAEASTRGTISKVVTTAAIITSSLTDTSMKTTATTTTTAIPTKGIMSRRLRSRMSGTDSGVTSSSIQESTASMYHQDSLQLQTSSRDGHAKNDNDEPISHPSAVVLTDSSNQLCYTRLNDTKNQTCSSNNGDALLPVRAVAQLSRCGAAQETSMFRDRSAAETEAAHDLLELSRSLPPLPPPSIAIGPQNVIETPPTDNVQEISIYQPAQPPPIYQINTIELTGGATAVYHQQSSGMMYDSIVPSTMVQQTSSGVFIPLSPVQEILFTYANASNGLPSILTTQPTPIEAPPLTPPASECSSDIENSNPNSQPPDQNDKQVQTHTDQPEVKAGSYTYDTLLVADGRSKNKKQTAVCQTTTQSESVEITDISESPDVPKTGRYVCCECGKQYATSSNLSRHKQTHRSIDSQSAKKCIHCGKAYVSMPALAMHVLTHKLTHSCGVCGKMFSRPWLLQGHLRSHTGEKPYGCAHCGKAFADRSNLRAHMQTHSSDKNYECPKCHKSFALKSYLNKHLESACQRDNCDESSNDMDTPSSCGVVSSSNNCTSENEQFSRMVCGASEANT